MNNITQTAQEEINQIIFEANSRDKRVTECWLASRLGISPQNLNYLLHTAKRFDNDIYKRIKLIFQKEGIISRTSDQCNLLSDQTLEFGAMIGANLAVLNNQVRRAIKDMSLDMRERLRLKMIIEDLRTNLIDQLDELDKIVES